VQDRQPIEPRLRRMLPAWWLAALALALAGAWPLLGAAPAGDDWSLIALVRLVDSPLDLYRFDHSFIYFYRPHAMALWWASVAALGDAWGLHYALNLALHAGCAALVAAYVHTVDGRRLPALVAGALFAAHPAALGAAAWLSDRFDLLCSLAVIGALLAAELALHGRRLAPFALVACAFLAAGSKEIALVLVPALALRLLLDDGHAWRWRLGLFLAAVLPMAVVFAARQAVLLDARVTTGLADPVADVAQGTLLWLVAAPTALLPGFPRALQVTVALALALAILAALVLAWRGRDPRFAPLAVAGALVLAPAPLLAPVTRLVLESPQALALTINYRFFYLPLALALVALALSWPRGMSWPRRAGALAVVTLALAAVPAMLWRAHGQASTWRDSTRSPEMAMLRTAADTLATAGDVAPRCRLYLLGTSTEAPTFLHYVDVAVKSLLPRESPVMACAILGERVPWHHLVRETPCAHDDWAPLAPVLLRGERVAPRAVGGVCAHFFEAPRRDAALADARARFFAFDAGVLVERTREQAAIDWVATP
jgi:hypothetical protein